MTTKEKYILVIAPNGAETRLPHKPKYPELQTLISGGRTGQLIERCKVQYNGKRCDCIVNEEGKLHSDPINVKATELYRADWKKNFPGADTNDAFLVGTAVVFVGWRF